MFNPGELPLVLLALLEEAPRNGYELMGALNRRFAPTYRASPGSVYPALAALRAGGLIEPHEGLGEGRERTTAEGRHLLRARAEQLAQIEVRTEVTLSDVETLDSLVDRFAAQVKHLGGRIDPRTLDRILRRARESITREVDRGTA